MRLSACCGGGRRRRAFLLIAWLVPAAVLAELPVEPIPNVETLDVPYPPSYAVVHDFAFSGLIDSKFALVDTNSRRYLGMMSAGQFATIDISVPRQRFYVGETVHTRGARGTRQDVVAIYDFENLGLVGEIDIPTKRMNVVVNQSATGITSDDRFLLISNMNPATSVTVIDLESETVAGEIPTPGCTLAYTQANGGFFSLCGNGGLLAITLDDKGVEDGRWSSQPFNDIDADPLSEKAAYIDGVWYFVSYGGTVQPIDTRGDQPELLAAWSVTTPEERAANWRPAGWHGKGGNDEGRMWVAMTPDGYNGSHKDPATHAWLFDVATGKRLVTTELKVPGLSIALSGGDTARLLVVNIEGALDVYDGETGAYVHTIKALGDTPYMVHTVE